jgi:hypothetical protein
MIGLQMVGAALALLYSFDNRTRALGFVGAVRVAAKTDARRAYSNQYVAVLFHAVMARPWPMAHLKMAGKFSGCDRTISLCVHLPD